jgi:hypothetical protein
VSIGCCYIGCHHFFLSLLSLLSSVSSCVLFSRFSDDA